MLRTAGGVGMSHAQSAHRWFLVVSRSLHDCFLHSRTPFYTCALTQLQDDKREREALALRRKLKDAREE
jgi:hypothetical protein